MPSRARCHLCPLDARRAPRWQVAQLPTDELHALLDAVQPLLKPSRKAKAPPAKSGGAGASSSKRKRRSKGDDSSEEEAREEEQAPEEERIQIQRTRLAVVSRREVLRQRWQQEREQLEELGQLLQQDEDLRHAIAEAERDGDLEEAARLQYDQLHTVQQRREELEAEQLAAQEEETALLRELSLIHISEPTRPY